MKPTTKPQEPSRPGVKSLNFDCVWTERFAALMQWVFRAGACLCLGCTLIVGFDLLAPGVESSQIAVFKTESIKPGKSGPQGLVWSAQYGNPQYTPTSIAVAAKKGDSISILQSRLIQFSKRHTLSRDGVKIKSAVTIVYWYYLIAIVFIGLLPVWVCLRPKPWKPGLISGFWMTVLQFTSLMVVARAVSATFGFGTSHVDGIAYWLAQGVFALALGAAFFLMVFATLSAWNLVVRRAR